MSAHSLSRTARSARLRHLSKHDPPKPDSSKWSGPDALPIELHPRKRSPDSNRGLSGVLPPQTGGSRWVVELDGLEPTTSGLQSRRSSW